MLDVGGNPFYFRIFILNFGGCVKRWSTRRFVITEKAPTMAFYWLKAATFTFKIKDRQATCPL